MKQFKPFYYIATVFVIGLLALIYFSDQKSYKTESKVKLSYFQNSTELVEKIKSVLKQEMIAEKYYWFGLEPGHQIQVDVLVQLKSELERLNGNFDLVIFDQEVENAMKSAKNFQPHKFMFIKQNWFELAELIKANKEKKVLVITASVYSTQLIEMNPIHKIIKDTNMSPIVISLGYLASHPNEEKNNVFPCATDDKEGVAAWGCLVINKSRSVRRKIDFQKINDSKSLIIGLIDQAKEKDYILLLR